MATTMELAIFVFCLIGSGICSWQLGRHEGIRGTVDYLVEEGIIELEE